MFANSSSVVGSASSPSSYRLYNFGPDGVDNSGGSDDIFFPITVASYNSVDNRATLTVDAVALNDPLRSAGSLYRIVALGADPIAGLRNLAGKRLDGGQDYSAIVSLTRTPILTGLNPTTSTEGSAITVQAALSHGNFHPDYQATIDWGDGSSSQTTGNNAFPTELFTATHIYADNGQYDVTISVLNGSTEIANLTKPFVINNVSPTLSAAASVTGLEGTTKLFALGSFRDPGFTSLLAGTSETFTGTIDWGDGSPVEITSLTVVNGSAGVESTGIISGTHAFKNNGTYNAILRVTNDDNGSGTVTVPLIIGNVLPVVDPLTPIAADEGALASFSLTASDPGTLDILTAAVDWGDGTSSNVAGTQVGTNWNEAGLPGYGHDFSRHKLILIRDRSKWYGFVMIGSFA